MSDCNHIIEQIYNNEQLNKLISKINPESIRDDLKQEVCLALLEKDCDYLTILHHEGNLVRYTLRIAWIMATSKTSTFYHKYKKSELLEAVKYLRSVPGIFTLSKCPPFVNAEAILPQTCLDSKFTSV